MPLLPRGPFPEALAFKASKAFCSSFCFCLKAISSSSMSLDCFGWPSAYWPSSSPLSLFSLWFLAGGELAVVALWEGCGHHGMLLCLLHCQLHGPELRQAQAAGEGLRGQDRVKAGNSDHGEPSTSEAPTTPLLLSALPTGWCAHHYLKPNISPHLVSLLLL